MQSFCGRTSYANIEVAYVGLCWCRSLCVAFVDQYEGCSASEGTGGALLMVQQQARAKNRLGVVHKVMKRSAESHLFVVKH